MQTRSVIENIKSIILVVLFFFTILLLYFLWADEPFHGFTRSDDLSPRPVVQYEEILRPSRISVCKGDESYVMAQDMDFDVIMNCFSLFSKDDGLSIEEITALQYKEILKYPSIKATFEYYVPFAAICQVFSIEKIAGAEGVDELSELGYSQGNPSSFFVYDKKSEKYFRVTGGGKIRSDLLDNVIEKAGSDSSTYFTLETNFGGQISNQVLIPASLESDLYDFPYTNELDFDENEKIEQIAKRFFSSSFDFVRRIEEQGGTIIYMYGFGKIVLIIDEHGFVEYKREDTERPSSAISYLDALDGALQFIAEHGAFETLEGDAYKPFLTSVTMDPGGRKGYRFAFNVFVGEHKLFYQNSQAIAVEVLGGRVSYFSRKLISHDHEAAFSRKGEFREVFSPMNTIAQNLEYINETLYPPTSEAGGFLTIEQLAERIEWFDCGYLLPETLEEPKVIQPAWVLKIEQTEFYFALEDGRPLGYSRK